VAWIAGLALVVSAAALAWTIYRDTANRAALSRESQERKFPVAT
jgi:hypothetical protein